MSVWLTHIIISYLNLHGWARKGKYIELLYMDWFWSLVLIRSNAGCWYPVTRKWSRQLWSWRLKGLGTVYWGSTIILIIRWMAWHWGEVDQSSSLNLTVSPTLQTCSNLYVRSDWRCSGGSVRRARQHTNPRNAHSHHWLVAGAALGILLATSSLSFADSDRILVQCVMNLVVLTVIFLLWANNPVEKKVAVD